MSEPTLVPRIDDSNALTIDYSVVALEEIRAEVAQGLLKFSRGGMEVGGVLYGARDGNKLHILAMRPIACDHSGGPSFHLSPDDRSKLEAQLAAESADPHLKNLTVLGWYVSHTRGEMTMTDADVEIFSSYFKEPWQVTMVVRPGRASQMRGGFFVREADGLVKQEQCFKEFAFPDRIAGVMEAMPRTERAAQRPSAPALPEIPLAQPAPIRQQAPISASAFEPVPYPSPSAERRRWPWLVAALGLVVVLAFVFLRYFWQPAPPEALGLQITEREGQLQIVWNPASRSIVRATKGLLEISDGDAAERVTLARAQMGEGRYLYTRLGGDVEVRMQVDTEDGPLSESARFLGRAPQAAKADELAAAQAQQTALEEENQKLKAENASLRDRIQQLERAQRILETRLGITGK